MRIACYRETGRERLPDSRVARRVFERLTALCMRLPIAAVAALARPSRAAMAKVAGRALELALGQRTAALAKMRWIGDGRGSRGLLRFLRALGRTGQRKLRGAVSDLDDHAILATRLRHACKCPGAPRAGDQHDEPLGLAEPINRTNEALRYQARGYRDPGYFTFKRFQHCSLPDHAWPRMAP